MRNSSDIGLSEELAAADCSIEAAQLLWHRAKTPLKKHDKGKIPRLNNTSFLGLLRGEELMFFLLLLKLDYIYIYVTWI